MILLCVQHVTGSEDINWDNPDMKWVKTSSMARLHRFLTTRDLHYQWFNPLIFGLVPPDDDGVTARSALAEVEQMKSAALLFAKNAGWSDKVGLFVNVFGHNNVNSLFIHVLDMSELGPAFSYHSFKNCPLDDVIKVLREEAASNFLPAPVKNHRPSWTHGESRGPSAPHVHDWRNPCRRRRGQTSFLLVQTVQHL